MAKSTNRVSPSGSRFNRSFTATVATNGGSEHISGTAGGATPPVPGTYSGQSWIAFMVSDLLTNSPQVVGGVSVSPNSDGSALLYGITIVGGAVGNNTFKFVRVA